MFIRIVAKKTTSKGAFYIKIYLPCIIACNFPYRSPPKKRIKPNKQILGHIIITISQSIIYKRIPKTKFHGNGLTISPYSLHPIIALPILPPGPHFILQNYNPLPAKPRLPAG